MNALEIRERQFDYGPQREAWVAGVPVAKVLAAVQIQLEYHERRLKLWQRRRGLAAARERRSIKAKEVAVTGGTQTVYESDPNATKAKQLAEVKIAEHLAKVNDLREWEASLEIEPEPSKTMLRLTHSDALFFKLSGHTPDEK